MGVVREFLLDDLLSQLPLPLLYLAGDQGLRVEELPKENPSYLLNPQPFSLGGPISLVKDGIVGGSPVGPVGRGDLIAPGRLRDHVVRLLKYMEGR